MPRSWSPSFRRRALARKHGDPITVPSEDALRIEPILRALAETPWLMRQIIRRGGIR